MTSSIGGTHEISTPWPRTLVRSLCQFLDAIQQPEVGRTQPSDLVTFGGGCETIARVYNLQEISLSKQPPFAFALEKRALQQLRKSREAREALMEKWKNRELNRSEE